jgi:NADP-dependent aldehyde dehydrogenase
MEQVIAAMHGHLTATVHGDDADCQQHAALLRSLEKRVGRVVHNGVPTGVEVCAAMQHGGPWPASSDSRFTAVGPRAILRWVRPVAWQDAPQHALPSALRDGNPLGIVRTIDGEVGRR